MTLDTDKLFKKNKFLKWIDFAFGFGLDDTQYLNSGVIKMGGKHEFYIALDYDINQIF